MTRCLARGGREPPDGLTYQGPMRPVRQLLAHLFAYLLSKEELIGEVELAAGRKEKL